MAQIKAKKVVSKAKMEELRNSLGDFKFGILQRIWEAYNYLVDTKQVNSVTELSQKLHRDYSNVVSIINGKRGVTPKIILDMNSCFGQPFNREWIINGDGEMLSSPAAIYQKTPTTINQAWATNSPNAIVNAACNGNAEVFEGGNVITNQHGDSPSEKMKWRPVVPASMTKQPGFDIFKQFSRHTGGNFEYLYAGTAPVDIWYYVSDNDLYPYYQKGDCIGLKAYGTGDVRIKTGNVYVVDTNRDGFIFRRFRILENGDLESYTFNESDPQSYVIPQKDIIRVYSVVLMFRY